MKKIKTKRVATQFEDREVCPICDREMTAGHLMYCDGFSVQDGELDFEVCDASWEVVTRFQSASNCYLDAILLDPDSDLWHVYVYYDYDLIQANIQPITSQDQLDDLILELRKKVNGYRTSANAIELSANELSILTVL